jgi:hypothetical protein
MTVKVSPKPKPIESSNRSATSNLFLQSTYDKKKPLANMKKTPSQPPSTGRDSIGVGNTLVTLRSKKRAIKETMLTLTKNRMVFRVLMYPTYFVL